MLQILDPRGLNGRGKAFCCSRAWIIARGSYSCFVTVLLRHLVAGELFCGVGRRLEPMVIGVCSQCEDDDDVFIKGIVARARTVNEEVIRGSRY